MQIWLYEEKLETRGPESMLSGRRREVGQEDYNEFDTGISLKYRLRVRNIFTLA